MTDFAANILELGMELDLDERTVVAHKLLVSLHDEDAGQGQAEAAWKGELRRRIDDVESGRVELVSHTETVALAREIAAGRR
ncbi:MAG TPA: addiction module protein [Marmoricola sp.]|nr:addiction module protein [Marmoricola sp.]